MASGQKFAKLPFILITSLFFVWGLANNMTDTLLAAFKRIMGMTDFQTSWIQIAFYGSYFCLAIPAALFIKRFTYKAGILLGLALFISGSLLFYPASISMEYGHFLAALFILAGGLAILETTANPYILTLGPKETGTRRLNLAQSFNPIGSILGIVLGKTFILSELHENSAAERTLMGAEELKGIQAAELNAVMVPYVGVALVMVLLWLLIYFVRMPKASDSDEAQDLRSTLKRLLKNKRYLLGIVAQFFYVGAQIGIWSFTIRYVMQVLEVNENEASNYYLVSLILFMVSRFVCTFLMKYVSPRTLLICFSALAMVATSCVIFLGGLVGVYALVLISGCMSLMYPTIYSLAIEGVGNDTKMASSGLVMAIIGGAVLTPVQGLISDSTQAISYSFGVPLFSFLVILVYAITFRGPLSTK